MSHEKSDSELIQLYIQNNDQTAIRVLVERHYDRLYKRFVRETRNEADAGDLSQKLWVQIIRNLNDSYRDEDKFKQYLSRAATNLLKDFWRNSQTRGAYMVAVEDYDSLALEDYDSLENSQYLDPSQSLDNERSAHKLVNELIPALPPEQRLVWLLKHESEYWEPGRRFELLHLAKLNGISKNEAWDRFESARRKYMSVMNHCRTDKASNLEGDFDVSEEEQVIYMVWTQANRVEKAEKYTWDYFADLLGVPVNTLKTRYRAAAKKLESAL